MNLLNIFTRAYKLVSQNVVLVQPLLIFMLLTSLIIPSAASLVSAPLIAVCFLLISIFALNSAFIAGWYCMFKEAIALSSKPVVSKEQYTENSISIFKTFTPGVGKYFVQTLLAMIVYFAVPLVFLVIVGYLATHGLGYTKALTLSQKLLSVKTQSEIVSILSTISKNDLAYLDKLSILTMIGFAVWNYLSLFYLQAVVMLQKSSLKAFVQSFKAVLKYPLKSFTLLLFSVFGFLFTNILTTVCEKNFILQLIALIISVYFMVYYVMVTFLYFEEYAESISNSRSDSL